MFKCLKDCLKLRFYFLAMMAVFALGIVNGILAAFFYPEDMAVAMQELSKTFGAFKELSNFSLFLVILLNNAIKSFLIIVFGLALGIIPVFFMYANGFILGIVGFFIVQKAGLVKTLILIAPHGILELPAAIFASALGLWLGIRFIYFITKKEPIKPAIIFSIKAYFQIIFPLMLIAALIEVYFTAGLA